MTTSAPATGSSPPTAFILHPDSVLHDTGWGHPEHQGRLRAITSALHSALPVLNEQVVHVAPEAATPEDVRLVHSQELVDLVRAAVSQAEEQGRPLALARNTVVSGASWAAALGSVGAGLEAVRGILEGRYRNAFVAARPPGHHATPERAMGFCLFNAVAVAAAWLRAKNVAKNVLILDWDVHHGNGTQDVFVADPSVFFLSLHQYPHYPGTGGTDETGTGPGEGFTLNVPLPAGTPRQRYLELFTRVLKAAVDRCAPYFVLVSCGFDVLAGDPLGDMLLEPEDLRQMTEQVREVAESSCDGRLVVFLEGGYNPKLAGAGCVQVVRALAGASSTGDRPLTRPHPSPKHP